MNNILNGTVCKFLFAFFDEITVLGVTRGVNHHRNAVLVSNAGGFSDVCNGNGLSACAVVGDGFYDNSYVFRAVLFNEFFQLFGIHVSLKVRTARRVESFGNDAVDRNTTGKTYMRAGGVKEHIGDSVLFAFRQNGNQNLFRRSALVNGLDILKSKNILCIFDKVKITARTGVRLVAHHDARPLGAAHGVCAAVGQQIDIDVFRFQRKLVIVCFRKFFLSFCSR